MKTLLMTLACIVFAALPVQADRFKDIEVKDIALGNNIYMLTGAGGNMAAVIAGNKVVLIDSQYAEMAQKINAKLMQLSGNNKLSTLINTHVHGDHVGGNAALAAQIDIIAHANVLSRLLQDDTFAKAGLPKTTFTAEMTLQLPGNTLRLTYMPPSHTDGDIVVWFDNANVVHMGDLLFEGRFPFIDTSKGGSVKGYIDNTRKIIAMLDTETKVIPGHGNLTDKAGVQRALDMMIATLAIVQDYKAAGLSEQQIIEKGLGEQFNSWNWSFITEARWISTLYNVDVN